MHFLFHSRSMGRLFGYDTLAYKRKKEVLTIDQLVLKAMKPPELHNVEDMLKSACGPSHVPIFWSVAEK